MSCPPRTAGRGSPKGWRGPGRSTCGMSPEAPAPPHASRSPSLSLSDGEESECNTVANRVGLVGSGYPEVLDPWHVFRPSS